MKNQAIPYVDLLRKEMELRNYSSRTISTYCHLLSTLQQATNVPLEDIDIDAFKEYLHKRITHDGI